MSPLVRANIGILVRAAILLLGYHGIEIAPDDEASFMRGLEMFINAGLIVGPLLWSSYQKWSQQRDLKSAELTAELAMRRG